MQASPTPVPLPYEVGFQYPAVFLVPLVVLVVAIALARTLTRPVVLERSDDGTIEHASP